MSTTDAGFDSTILYPIFVVLFIGGALWKALIGSAVTSAIAIKYGSSTAGTVVAIAAIIIAFSLRGRSSTVDLVLTSSLCLTFWLLVVFTPTWDHETAFDGVLKTWENYNRGEGGIFDVLSSVRTLLGVSFPIILHQAILVQSFLFHKTFCEMAEYDLKASRVHNSRLNRSEGDEIEGNDKRVKWTMVS